MNEQEGKVATAPDQAIKDTIGAVAELCLLISNVTQGFSISEIIEGIDVMDDVRTVVAEAPVIAAQFAALDEPARQDCYAFIAANVSFPANANVQLICAKVLDVAVALSYVLPLVVTPPVAPVTPAA